MEVKSATSFKSLYDEGMVSRLSYNQSQKIETRKTECAKILAKYPDRIPIVLERQDPADGRSQRLPELTDNKFLVRRNNALFQFQAIVRLKLKLVPSQVLYLVFPSGTLYSGGNIWVL